MLEVLVTKTLEWTGRLKAINTYTHALTQICDNIAHQFSLLRDVHIETVVGDEQKQGKLILCTGLRIKVSPY